MKAVKQQKATRYPWSFSYFLFLDFFFFSSSFFFGGLNWLSGNWVRGKWAWISAEVLSSVHQPLQMRAISIETDSSSPPMRRPLSAAHFIFFIPYPVGADSSLLCGSLSPNCLAVCFQLVRVYIFSFYRPPTPFFACSPRLAPCFDNAFQSGVANLEFMKKRHRDGIIIQMSARHKWLSDKCAGPVLHLNKFLFSFEPAALWSQAKEFSFIVQGPLYLCL